MLDRYLLKNKLKFRPKYALAKIVHALRIPIAAAALVKDAHAVRVILAAPTAILLSVKSLISQKIVTSLIILQDRQDLERQDK